MSDKFNIIEFNVRLHQFVKSRSISYKKFGDSVGFKSGALSKIFNDNMGFGVEKLINIFHRYPEANSEWLMFGRGEMINPAYRYGKKMDSENLTENDVPEAYKPTFKENGELKKEVEKLKIENNAYLKALREIGKNQ